MYNLRCTKRVLDRFKLEARPREEEPPAETLLGDWYANLLNVGRKQWVFCVSERTLLAVLVPARKKEFPGSLLIAVDGVLSDLGVSAILRDRERLAMDHYRIARTRSRSILGAMNELSFAAEIGLQDGMALSELSLWLAETPMKPIGHESPGRLVRELFRAFEQGRRA